MRISRKKLQHLGIHAILILTLLAVAFPIYYAFIMATHTHQDAYAFPPILTPGDQLMPNITEAWSPQQQSHHRRYCFHRENCVFHLGCICFHAL